MTELEVELKQKSPYYPLVKAGLEAGVERATHQRERATHTQHLPMPLTFCTAPTRAFALISPGDG